jgi:DNA repair protein SbcC/Rad50
MPNEQTKRYIERLKIEDFQDHRLTDVRFKPGINLIVGSSDVGKSALLRALNWVLHDEPKGKSFIRRGASEAKVTVYWSDGTVVQRIKSDHRNAVILETPEQKYDPFEKIGRELPQEVIDAMGNPPKDERHGAISYADQMAPLYLVSLSKTELPRAIAEMMGIDDLDEAAQNLATKSRQFGNKAKETEKRIAALDNNLLFYANLEDRLESCDEIEGRMEKLESLYGLIENARELIEERAELQRLGANAKVTLERATSICQLKPALDEIEQTCSEIKALQSIIERRDEVASGLAEAQQRLKTLQSVTDGDYKEKVSELGGTRDSIADARDLIDRRSAIRVKKGEAEAELRKQNALADEVRRELAEMADEMRELGLWCDTCQRPVKVELN